VTASARLQVLVVAIAVVVCATRTRNPGRRSRSAGSSHSRGRLDDIASARWPPGRSGARGVLCRREPRRRRRKHRHRGGSEERAGRLHLLVTADMIAANAQLYKLAWIRSGLRPVIQLARQRWSWRCILARREQRGGARRAGEAGAGARLPTSGAGSQQHMAASGSPRSPGSSSRTCRTRAAARRSPICGRAGEDRLARLLAVIPHYKAGKLKVSRRRRGRARQPARGTTYEEAASRASCSINGWACSSGGTPPEIVTLSMPKSGKALADPAIRERYAQAALERSAVRGRVRAARARRLREVRPADPGARHQGGLKARRVESRLLRRSRECQPPRQPQSEQLQAVTLRAGTR